MEEQKIEYALGQAIRSLSEHEKEIAFIKRRPVKLSDLSGLPTDQLLSLLIPSPGTKLYKYCPYNHYAVSNIANGVVHLSDPETFDDVFDSMADDDAYFFVNLRLMRYLLVLGVSFDWNLDNEALTALLFQRLGQCGPTFDEFKKYLADNRIDEVTALRLQYLYLNAVASQVSPDKSLESALIDEFQEFSKRRSQYRISCFTTRPNMLKMWSLYADNSKGICIEYTIPEETKLLVLSVIYSRTRGNARLLALLDDMHTNDAFIRSLTESVLRKDICWIEQDEYRLVCPKNEFPDDLCPFFPMTGIYMGNRMALEKQAEVKRQCEELHIPCFYMKRALASFDFSPVSVD